MSQLELVLEQARIQNKQIQDVLDFQHDLIVMLDEHTAEGRLIRSRITELLQGLEYLTDYLTTKGEKQMADVTRAFFEGKKNAKIELVDGTLIEGARIVGVANGLLHLSLSLNGATEQVLRPWSLVKQVTVVGDLH